MGRKDMKKIDAKESGICIIVCSNYSLSAGHLGCYDGCGDNLKMKPSINRKNGNNNSFRKFQNNHLFAVSYPYIHFSSSCGEKEVGECSQSQPLKDP